MIYLKCDDDRNLAITVNGAIYRGDILNQNVIILVPATIDEIDILSATVYLTYIRADGVPDIEALERLDEMYNDDYYQFTLPVTSRLTKCAGSVCIWLQIVSGTLADIVIAKTGECILYIQESKNLDDYVCDHMLTAVYKVQQEMDSAQMELESVQSDVETMQTDIESISSELENVLAVSGGDDDDDSGDSGSSEADDDDDNNTFIDF